MRRLWPGTECVLTLLVLGLLAGWYVSGKQVWDALLGRPSVDERLITAAATMDGDAFDTALAAGARPTSHDPNGMTALAYAAITGSEARVSRLLAAGADVNASDKWGFTALMQAAEYDRGDIVRLLLERGADPLLRNHQGQTAADRARMRDADSASAALASRQRPTAVAELPF
jgi:ankyrin repeat protein